MKRFFREILNEQTSNSEIKKPDLKFKLSNHIKIPEINMIKEKECEIIIESKITNISENFDLSVEDKEIPYNHPEEETIQLFDGYIGEKNFDPNPLEYGPNAMYRRNGTVYRKSVDNLWEAYLKDGSPGARGAAGGSGTGVQEVQKITNESIQTQSSIYNLIGVNKMKTKSAASNVFHSSPTSTTSSTWTIGEQLPVAAEFYGIVPTFVNTNVSSTMLISASKVAASPTDNAEASTLTWRNITFDLKTSAEIPAAKIDLTTGILSPGLLVADPIPVESIARTDIIGGESLIQIRTLYPNGGKFSAIAANFTSAFRISTGREYSNITTNSDLVTTPTGQPSSAVACYRAMFVKFLFKQPVLDLLIIGDSTNAGVGSDSTIFNAGRVVQKLLRNEYPMEIINFAIGGQSLRYTYHHWKSIIDTGYRPKAVLIPSWTVNSSLDAYGFSNCLTHCLTIASEALELGIIPIIQTPPPASSLTGGNITLWKNLYDKVLSLSGDYLIADQTKSVMDPNDLGHYLSSRTSDGLHPNEAGYNAKGLDLLPVIRSIIYN